ncbi:MAG: MFS transporter, partial [Opitutales bacterium]
MKAFSYWLYEKVTDVTKEEIESPENALAKNAPANFVRLLIARTCSKISDRLASPKTTLAWLLQTVGAPPIFLGLIVPLRESGSLLPQVILSNWLKRFSIRKWAWTIGALTQAAAIAGCAAVALTLTGRSAGITIVALIAVFSLARGISSVSAKDILGKTIPKSKRGQLTGWAGSVSGVIAIASAGFLLLYDASEGSTRQYAIFLGAASFLWCLAAAANARIQEPSGETEESDGLLAGLGEQIALLKEDAAFRDFLIVRALAVSSGLSAPYIISLAHTELGGATYWLGVFIIAEGLAAMLTAPLWGRWADKSSRRALRIAMALVFCLLTSIVLYVTLFRQFEIGAIAFPAILFLLGAAHTGVRVGRKTYVVDMAGGNKRTDYVAVSNTVIGVALLAVGGLSSLASLISVEAVLVLLGAMGVAGALSARFMREV